jgi:single-stranded DNA-binding protein
MSAIRITGTLGRDAQARYTHEGQAWLFLEIHQGPGSIAVEARRCIGKGPSAQIAASRTAAYLRKGSRVTVHADAYTIGSGVGYPYLLLANVSSIEHQPVRSHYETDQAA